MIVVYYSTLQNSALKRLNAKHVWGLPLISTHLGGGGGVKSSLLYIYIAHYMQKKRGGGGGLGSM